MAMSKPENTFPLFSKGGVPLHPDTPKFQKVTQVAMLKMKTQFICESREGILEGQAGDYLVADGHGGFYPVSAEFHEANYKLVDEDEAQEDTGVSEVEQICNHLLAAMGKVGTTPTDLAALAHAYNSVTYDRNSWASEVTSVKDTEKTLHNSTVSGARKNVKDIQVVGNGDTFKLVCKASSEAEGWMKSTKVCEIPSVGCMVQVTTQQRNPDGSYAVAEALTFVPDVQVIHDVNNSGGRKIVRL